LGADGAPLTSAHLLYLATAAGARALGLADRVGDLGTGKRFDALLLRPPPGTPPGRTRHWPGSSPSRPPRTWPRCGSTAWRSSAAGRGRSSPAAVRPPEERRARQGIRW
ncbi:MAG TPA: amidohydrolase family protein, partial [Jatrophihabitans sp.]|nr:amidohydrolase family protein [Jatrophihabitans sp.]